MARFRAMPYARAFFSVLGGEGAEVVERSAGELAAMVEALHAVPELNRVMVTPTVNPETKTAILDEIMDGLGIVGTTRRFLHVLQRHYRLEQLPEVVAAYREVVDRSMGRVRARVETPIPLAAGQQKKLISVLEGVVHADVVPEFMARPELLAGFRVQVGSKVFDGSLVGQIDQLRRQAGAEQG
jgi:F-type H+-transporting ATPase subunit delta